MNEDVFHRIRQAIETDGASAAFERLSAALRAERNYPALFEALLMRARFDLGLPLIRTGSAQDLPEAVREPYEERMLEACQTVGELYLQGGDIPTATRTAPATMRTPTIRRIVGLMVFMVLSS